MAKLSDFSQGVLTAAIILYILVFIYALYHDGTKEKELIVSNDTVERYYQFADELSDDMRKYKIGKIDQRDIEMVVRGILEKKEKEKSLFKRLVNSGKTGVFLGGLSGAITGGAAGALATGVVFGLINPIVIVINEFLYMHEELETAKQIKEKEKIKRLLGHYSHLPPQ